MSRRALLKAGLALPAAKTAIRTSHGQNPWRIFAVRVVADVIEASVPVQLWLPLPLTTPSPYQRTVTQQWSGNAKK